MALSETDKMTARSCRSQGPNSWKPGHSQQEGGRMPSSLHVTGSQGCLHVSQTEAGRGIFVLAGLARGRSFKSPGPQKPRAKILSTPSLRRVEPGLWQFCPHGLEVSAAVLGGSGARVLPESRRDMAKLRTGTPPVEGRAL